MALVSPKGRLVADPCIGVEDTTGATSKVFKDKNARDLWELLKSPRGITFKSGANAQRLASIHFIMVPLTEIAPNGMLPPKKTRMALQKLHGESPINFTKKNQQRLLRSGRRAAEDRPWAIRNGKSKEAGEEDS